MSFEILNLKTPISRAIADLGFQIPSEIQAQAIPILQKSTTDFVGQAQTGTGKTAAFVIPLLEKIDPISQDIQAMIITPTRELANQVHIEVEKIAKYTTIKSSTIYGGVSYLRQKENLKINRPQIIVGTPGRIVDLIEQGSLRLQKCHTLVIDEADEMLNMGFIEDVQIIIDSLNTEKRMWMFSATMPAPIMKLVKMKFYHPQIIRTKDKTLSNGDVKQCFCVVKKKHFSEALLRVIHSTNECYGMVFCETRHETKELAELLLLKGLSVVALHGELSQAERDFAMKKFKSKKANLLICTDVASRGIDVNNMSHVFNMGLPRQDEAYVHRIGRTGRAGMKGISISFIVPDQMAQIRRIQKMTRAKIEKLTLPHPSELKKIRISNELDKMKALKCAIIDKKEAFQVDSSYQYFKSYFQDLSKEQILKLLFSYQFNKEIRQLNDTETIEIPLSSPSRRNRRRR